MPHPPRPYVLNKYLPGNGGRIEINLTAITTDEYEIDNVFFIAQHGHVVITEDITCYMLATRLCLNDDIDTWISELLPEAMAADGFMEQADAAYAAKFQ